MRTKSAAGEIQIGERKQRKHLRAILGDAAIAHLGLVELATHDTEHVLHFGAHLCRRPVPGDAKAASPPTEVRRRTFQSFRLLVEATLGGPPDTRWAPVAGDELASRLRRAARRGGCRPCARRRERGAKPTVPGSVQQRSAAILGSSMRHAYSAGLITDVDARRLACSGWRISRRDSGNRRGT